MCKIFSSNSLIRVQNHKSVIAGNTVIEEGGTRSVLDIAIAMGLVAVAMRLVARGVGTGAGRVRMPASVSVVSFISIGSIVVVVRSVGAVAISRGVSRGVVTIVGGGIANFKPIHTS